ncbi:flagellar basal-body rod protein FlgB, putative [Novosphingobium sp. Rr 2-17]|uniref:flagellar basal body rod protein FlgB n=1 Tax=Novosphingobium sp. Rr 2-17 TaxID=555793 RepID=UPI0002699226|nr:flagellar basal body rod protein FlgB [Novosphingobium sp. Rr 2-17]EIZ78720.1 flagellar basal-body rod protein FlgB, putative [Novosphingobium sp. Rr 2-17]
MSTPSLLAGIGLSMKNLSERQRVIAQNIANSDTPGFKAREVNAPSFSDLLPQDGSKPSVARPRISLTSGMSALGARQPMAGNIVLDSATSETKPDGNNVAIEDQLLKMGQIQADFATMTSLYRKQIGLLKSAIGRGQ